MRQRRGHFLVFEVRRASDITVLMEGLARRPQCRRRPYLTVYRHLTERMASEKSPLNGKKDSYSLI